MIPVAVTHELPSTESPSHHATRSAGIQHLTAMRDRIPANTGVAGALATALMAADRGEEALAVIDACREAGAASVYSAVLVSKRRKRVADAAVDYVGLEVADRYVFGYGLDYKGYLRNAPGIFAVGNEA